MTKAEQEHAYGRYRSHMSRAERAARNGEYRRAVQEALEAWPHIDGMMQYAGRYEQEQFDSISAIDLVLKYAPLLLDFRLLDELETMLRKYRRIERDTSRSLADQLAEARERMWAAHRLWDHLETNPDARQADLRLSLGGRQDDWVAILTTWEKMGLLQRIPHGNTYKTVFCTRMGQLVCARCPECGGITEAPKAMFLEPLSCPACRATASFVLTPNIAENTEG